MSKHMKQLAVFAVAHSCVVFFILFLLVSGKVTLFIPNFGVDANDRLYIGEYKSIRIFQAGLEVGNICLNSTNYAFTVAEDTILLAYPSRTQMLDIEGNVLNESKDLNAEIYARLQNAGRTIVSPNGDEYHKAGSLGWTRIIKNDSEVVYRISPLSFVAKLLMWLVSLSLFINGVFLIKNIHKLDAQR